jgi:hypothetical protein
VNIPTDVSTIAYVLIDLLTVVWRESFSENDTKELVRYTAVIQTNLTLLLTKLDFQRLEQIDPLLFPELIKRIFQRLLSGYVQNEVVVQGDLQPLLDNVQVWLTKYWIKLAHHLMSVLSMIILCHHAGEVDDAEKFDEVIGWVEFWILQKVQCVQLQFPVEVFDRFLDGVHMLVQIRYLERAWPYVELALVFV